MRVYLIEDESLIRELVCSFLGSLTDVEVIGQADDGITAMQEIETLKPDLVFTDIRLPEFNGMEVLYLLKRRFPKMKVILFSGSVTPDKVRLAFEGGADGFVEKGSGLEDFEEAIKTVSTGGRFFQGHIYRILVELKGPKALQQLSGSSMD